MYYAYRDRNSPTRIIADYKIYVLYLFYFVLWVGILYRSYCYILKRLIIEHISCISAMCSHVLSPQTPMNPLAPLFPLEIESS